MDLVDRRRRSNAGRCEVNEIHTGDGIRYVPGADRRVWRGPALTDEGRKAADVLDAMGRMLEDVWSAL